MKTLEQEVLKKIAKKSLFVKLVNTERNESLVEQSIDEDRAVNYQCDSEGTALNYEVISEAISAVRCSAPLGSNWKKRIDEDFKKRGNRK